MKKSLRTLALLLCCAAVLATVALAAGTYTKTLTAYYRDIKLSVNGQIVVPKDAAGKVVDPFIVDGTTYLPVRAVSEALGKTVDWDGKNAVVKISDPAPGFVGTWKAVRVSQWGKDLPLSTFAGGSFTIQLNKNGTGTWVIDKKDYAVTWTEENGALTITDTSGSPTYGTVYNETMVLNIEGTFVTLAK